eukprot:gb/GEZN01018173.1/.p1 GENE.gb/GEZN01018173.1/~~gb/GEZN01018173.1/.p1  ORF type:complete len:204 (-),score=44.90 gb/GEZN01018173.1/:32-643(-)
MSGNSKKRKTVKTTKTPKTEKKAPKKAKKNEIDETTQGLLDDFSVEALKKYIQNRKKQDAESRATEETIKSKNGKVVVTDVKVHKMETPDTLGEFAVSVDAHFSVTCHRTEPREREEGDEEEEEDEDPDVTHDVKLKVDTQTSNCGIPWDVQIDHCRNNSVQQENNLVEDLEALTGDKDVVECIVAVFRDIVGDQRWIVDSSC